MSKVINRFWDWLFHPSIRWPWHNRSKTLMYRYPSPGSVIEKDIPADYRQPFQDSKYNIRYTHNPPQQKAEGYSLHLSDGATLTVQQKLIACGFLDKKDVNNKESFQKARQQFIKKVGCQPQRKVYVNDFNQTMPNFKDRESVKSYIQASFISKRQGKGDLIRNYRKKIINDPSVLTFQSLDLYCDPVFQQKRIQNQYMIDQIIKNRQKAGKLEVMKGQASFWKALDNSNDPSNIEKVQRSISTFEPNDFKLRDRQIIYVRDQKGTIIDIDSKVKQ